MFKTEASFVDTITHTVRKNGGNLHDRLKKYEKIVISQEVALGYGIADIVIAKYQSRTTLPTRSSKLNLFDISLLRLIKNKKEIDFDKIFCITKSSKQKIENSIQKLITNKIIEVSKENYYSYKNYKSVLTNSIAIEAKLKNWKRALNQAYRYKWFSEKSFVFIPEENIQPAYNNVELFKKMNVGLATVSADKKINILFDPIVENPYSEEMSILLNECLLVTLSSAVKRPPKKKGDNLN